MKKLLLTFVTLIYMVMSSGIAMEIHYCMGKRAGVDLYETSSDKCGRCGMTEKKGGCCSDEHQFYKLADAHKNVYNDYQAFIATPVVNPPIDLLPAISSLTIVKELIPTAPPGDYGPSLFIKNRVFRI